MLNEIVFASHNAGKIKEIKELLTPLNIRVMSTFDIEFPEVEETGTTFEENAILKALAVARFTGKTCLADDSGLCVKALNGRPGVYSARYAPDRDFNKGMDKLLTEISNAKNSDRSAYFACVLVLGYPDGSHVSFEGRVNGVIADTKHGSGGFGFDPVFIPDGYKQTFAELGSDVKNKISHRGRAMAKFVAYLKEHNDGENL